MTDPTLSATPPAPRRKGFLRRLLKLVGVLLLLVFLAPLALRLSFVRDMLARKASAALGAPVTIAEASAWWWSGVTLEGVVIGSPAGFDGPLATIERVHASVGLGQLLGGSVDARVEVQRPYVTLRKQAGRWNTAQLGRDRPPTQPSQGEREGGGGAALELVLSDGVFEAHGVGTRVERISSVSLTAHLRRDGGLEAVLGALAEKAGLDGADVRLAFKGGKAPGVTTPLEVTLPELDLARIAGLVEGLSGLTDIRGTSHIDARGSVDAQGRLQGKVTLGARGLAVRLSDGTRVSVRSVVGTIDATQGPSGEEAQADLTLEQVELVEAPGALAGAEPGRRFAEPVIRARFHAQRQADGRMLLPQLELSAGQALTLRGVGPLSIVQSSGALTGIQGKAELTADLARLAALKTIVPALASLTSGVLSMSLDGRPSSGLDLGLGARVTNLVLGPGAIAPEGYTDPDITLQANLQQQPDGSSRVLIYDVQSAVARLKAPQPFELSTSKAGALSLAGPLDLSVDLAALSRLLGSSLGLAAGERLAGTLTLRGEATGTPSDGRLTAALAGARLVLPRAWSRAQAGGALSAQLGLAWTATQTTASLRDLKGLGLAGEASAVLSTPTTGPSELSSAKALLSGDLAQLASWFGGALGLATTTQLSGRLKVALDASSSAQGLTLSGTTQAADLLYADGPAGTRIEEPALTVEHTLLLAKGGGATRLEALRLRGNGYAADLSGSTLGSGPGGAMHLVGTLTGDSARIAERVRALLGEDLRDLAGQGQVTGRFTLDARGEDLLAAATTDVDLTLGSWSASGATLAGAHVTLKRGTTTQPYAVAVDGTLNGGATTVRATLLPAGKALGWSLTTTLKGVDMGQVVTRGGGAKYLSYVLPTLVPLDSATPVLSGKLDLDLSLKAADVAGPVLDQTLQGQGRVALTQGTLGQSSLFGALGSGEGLGQIGPILTKVVPEVGQELARFTRSVAFQEITSVFRVGQQRVDVDDTQLIAPSHRLAMKGVVGFDEQVDLSARLWLGSRAGDELKKVLPDQTIPLRIRNTLADPQIVPDLSAADLLKAAGTGLIPNNPADLLKDPKKLEEEAKKLLKDRFRGLFPK